MQDENTDEHRNVLNQIAEARKWRNHFAPIYNTFYELAAPERLRVDNQTTIETPKNPSDQDSIFDVTLQQAAQNYASDFADEFTPGYRNWTKHEPSAQVPVAARKPLDDYIKSRQQRVFDAIRASGYEEASQEAYLDSAIGPFAVEVRYTRAGRPIDVEYVPLRELLIMPGPYGNVGYRFRERSVKICHLDTIFPDCDWSKVKPTKNERKNAKGSVVVISGGYRDWSKTKETWRWFVIHNNKVVKEKTFSGRGSCPLIVARIGVSQPSAYGLGPGSRAIAAARTLNELAYLELRRVGKVVDPPGWFSDPDGVFNPELGMDAGMWYEAGAEAQIVDMAPSNDVREAIFKREDLRMDVLSALFQDKPYQRGATPPSATQWAGEQAAMEKRKALPRGRIHSEWVIPLIERFEWVLQKRGELEDFEIDGAAIDVRPVSPLSKAADLEDAQIAMQFMSVIQASGEPMGAIIDTQETYENLRSKFGDDVVKLLSKQEREALIERAELTGGALG